MGKRVRPFAGRCEFIRWKADNCERCALRWQAGRGYLCDIDAALDYSHLNNGTVRASIGERMGFSCQHVAEECPEREMEEAVT